MDINIALNVIAKKHIKIDAEKISGIKTE